MDEFERFQIETRKIFLEDSSEIIQLLHSKIKNAIKENNDVEFIKLVTKLGYYISSINDGEYEDD